MLYFGGMLLATPVKTLPRVGESAGKILKRLGVATIRDLLYHFPFRYEDYRLLAMIKDLRADDFVTIFVRILQIRSRRSVRSRKHITEALVGDSTGSMRVMWFHQPYLIKTLREGEEIYLSGRAMRDRFGLLMMSPAYEKCTKDSALHTGRLVPMYPITYGITQKQFRTLVHTALSGTRIEEWLPKNIIVGYKIQQLHSALGAIHFPSSEKEATIARTRFDFEKSLLWQLSRELVRRSLECERAPEILFQKDLIRKFVSELPFQLTDDQKKSAFTILKDMELPRPMNRLLQGDVGSGKTVVAAIAAYSALANGLQVVLLAPTQLLAVQHRNTMRRLFEHTGFQVELCVSGRVKKISEDHLFLVGTHALLHAKNIFHNLGLVIVDEQHRFGVEQRHALKKKNETGFTPHFLSMTATPIPRSLALAAFGELNTSFIRKMPVGRKEIITRIISESERISAEQFIRERVLNHEQIFVVAPIIDPSDTLGIESAIELFERMKSTFKNAHISLLHGRQKVKEREAVMAAMQNGNIDILVATAVIEVGIDIPNATVIWIESAERFGLASLHQFRGRVGRGDKQSYCLLSTNASGGRVRERLELLARHSDGFTLAEKDLEIRGSGELFGILQSGDGDWQLLNQIAPQIWRAAHTAAHNLLREDESLEKYPELKERLAEYEFMRHRE